MIRLKSILTESSDYKFRSYEIGGLSISDADQIALGNMQKIYNFKVKNSNAKYMALEDPDAECKLVIQYRRDRGGRQLYIIVSVDCTNGKGEVDTNLEDIISARIKNNPITRKSPTGYFTINPEY